MTSGLVVAVLAAAAAASDASSPGAAGDLTRTLGGALVDWTAGTVTARAGAAADYRLPSIDMARPGAERRARALALAKLKAALAELPVAPGRRLSSDEITGALGRARTASIDYQSNGGVMVALRIGFPELTGGDAAVPGGREAVLSVDAAALELCPVLVAGREEVRVRFALYRRGRPPASGRAAAARRDGSGRLVVSGPDADIGKRLAGGRVVIYVQNILR